MVPKMMQDATIAIEDKSFWTNPGIDIGGIIRAMNANASSGTISQGGSTITQQLIKTRLLTDEPTFTRKIKEAILALEATRTFLGADVFPISFIVPDDQGIGQRPEVIMPYVDYFCPMVYPSHYGPGVFGYGVPNNFPYEVVDETLERMNRQAERSSVAAPARETPTPGCHRRRAASDCA